MIQEIEQKRVECNRLMRNKNKGRKISKYLKTPEMLEKEAQQAKWKTSKVVSFYFKKYTIEHYFQVREELCLVQEAYQFLKSRFNQKLESDADIS